MAPAPPGVPAPVRYRPAVDGDAERCVALLASLPDYFTPSTHADLAGQVGRSPAWVAEAGGAVVGVVVCPRRFTSAAEITYAAVARERWGQGVGSHLVELALRDLAAAGVTLVEVKTLDASAGYAPYERTRAFWERHGFVQIDAISPLPGWDPASPAAIYARAVPTGAERPDPP